MDCKRDCFIITPIGNEDTPIRRHIDGIIDAVISPVMENDYNILVAHRLFDIGSINKQIIELIYKSDLVIANLTETNPNVMYELAFRHTLGLPALTIAEKGTKLPFDILTERTIFYTNDLQGTVDAKKDLERYLSQINYDKKKSSGPIHDYLDTEDLKNRIYNQSQNKDNVSEVLELMVKRLESIENTIPHIGSEVKNSVSHLESFTPKITSEILDEIAEEFNNIRRCLKTMESDSNDYICKYITSEFSIGISNVSELVTKGLKTIEKEAVPNIKKELSTDLVEEILKSIIKQTPDINITKLNMSIDILNEKICDIHRNSNEISTELHRELKSLINYVNNNTINGVPNISSEVFKYKLNECIKIIDRFRYDIDRIVMD
ncbi:hypothetical protein [Enterocloster bolteae]|uniref:hypothetical protein n=1 Tax=Enterocloster bolteae TaxID=208479 RepID=UPI0028DB96C4|nr:hypothetical protein [Enterocloster bolteae]